MKLDQIFLRSQVKFIREIRSYFFSAHVLFFMFYYLVFDQGLSLAWWARSPATAT